MFKKLFCDHQKDIKIAYFTSPKYYGGSDTYEVLRYSYERCLECGKEWHSTLGRTYLTYRKIEDYVSSLRGYGFISEEEFEIKKIGLSKEEK